MLLSRFLSLSVVLVLVPAGSVGCKRPTDPEQSGPTTAPASADATPAAGAPSLPGPPGAVDATPPGGPPSPPGLAADATPPAGAPSPPGPGAAADAVRAPEGYVAMGVLRVVPTPHGNAVLLEHEAEQKLVVIFVGGTEALSIELRRDRQRYPRPLTHDLLDSLIGRLGGELVKVHVDDLKGRAFVGRVYVRQNGHVIDVDARPSDAIALALGNRAPIYVSRKVIDTAGVRKDELTGGDDLPPEVVARPRPSPTSL
ncbi:MAG TPA: bifunctional nuclease family protein [Polyangiaceae bacterium]|nr:bifunctional nuclease family protein [Polyangiaceae bacterium]